MKLHDWDHRWAAVGPQVGSSRRGKGSRCTGAPIEEDRL